MMDKPDIFIPIEWGTHITCSDCGEKIERGIANWAEHHFKCTKQKTEDAEFEIVQPKQITNDTAKGD